jgi:hypothetical protein
MEVGMMMMRSRSRSRMKMMTVMMMMRRRRMMRRMRMITVMMMMTMMTMMVMMPTMITLCSRRQGPARVEAIKQRLSYWAVAAITLAGRLCCEQLYLDRVLAFLPFGQALLLFFFLWLHMPFGGQPVVEAYIIPLLQTHLGTLLQGLNKAHDVARRGVGALVFMRVMSEGTGEWCLGHVDELVLSVPVAIFFFTWFTGFGVIFVSLLYPMLGSIRSMDDHHGSGQRWTQYWIVYAILHVLMMLFVDPLLGWLPFSNHAKLLLYTWVIIPYFNGRERIYNFVHHIVQVAI